MAAASRCGGGGGWACMTFSTRVSPAFLMRLTTCSCAAFTTLTSPTYSDMASSTHTHTHTHPFNGPFSGTTRVSRYQKGKTNLDLLKQEIVSGSGISWAICKSASSSRQITTPATHHSSFFTGRMPFIPPNQQRQSTEGKRHGQQID